MDISDKRRAASRANGSKSRGPVTLSGKNNSSRNAERRHQLSNALLLTGESADLFKDLLTSLHHEFRPQSELERMLIDTMAASTIAPSNASCRSAQISSPTLPPSLPPTSPPEKQKSAKRTREVVKKKRSSLGFRLIARFRSGYSRVILGFFRVPHRHPCITAAPGADTFVVGPPKPDDCRPLPPHRHVGSIPAVTIGRRNHSGAR
jgi:hypothetical protein